MSLEGGGTLCLWFLLTLGGNAFIEPSEAGVAGLGLFNSHLPDVLLTITPVMDEYHRMNVTV